MRTLQSCWIAILAIFCGIHISAVAQEIDIESKQETVNRLLSKLDQSTSLENDFHINRGLYYVYINDDIDEAIKYVTETVELAEELNFPEQIAFAYCDLAHAYMKKGDFDAALSYIETAHEYINEYKLVAPVALHNFNLGLIYLELGLHSVSKRHLVVARDNFQNPRDRWLAEYELYRASLKLKESSEIDADSLLSLIPEENQSINADYLYHYLVTVELFTESGQIKKAKTLLYRIQPFIEKHDRRYYSGIMNLAWSNIHYEEGDLLSALAIGIKSLETFREQKENSYKLKMLLKLSRIYEKMDMYPNAYQLQSEYYEQYNSITNHHKMVISKELLQQSDATADAETELQRSNKQLKQRQLYNFALVLLLIGVLVLLYLVYNSSKERKIAAAKLHRINQDKDHFIGVVSHDLRSPLNTIMMLSSLMSEDPESIDDATLKEYTGIIFNSSRRMEYLINNMLDANKIETGTTKLKIRPTSLNAAIHEVYQGVKILGDDKAIQTVMNLPDEEIIVQSEHSALVRIIENLMSNAYKFSEHGSTVMLVAGEKNDMAYISISDEGPGLSELDRSRLFRKFEKLSASPTGNEKTTGLGLFIVKNLLDEMNGTVEVDSELGKGTTFTVFLKKR